MPDFLEETTMTRLNEQIETTLPVDTVFDFVADFANAERWDPGVDRSVRLDVGPIRPGSRFALDVRMGKRIAPMTYRVAALDRPRSVLLMGAGSGVDAIDEITFEPTQSGTRIIYTADIRLRGLLRLAQPFLSGVLTRIGRDAAEGMRVALADLAASRVAARS
jgi:carbon monoxide dehydrogenase subunit G